MIMPRSADQLLLPVNPLFVGLTLLFALALNIVPLGRMAAMPDFLALVLVFWNVHQSRRVGVGLAFFFGLLMDVHDGAVLGQHALAYTLLSFFAITIHRRLLWFTVPSQAVQILPLFFAAHAVSLIVRMIAGGMFPGWELLLAPVFGGLLWFTVPSQAVQILPLFFAAHAVSLIVRMIAGGMFPGWELLLAPVFEALLWPIATWLLLAPQRRPPDRDENRPL